jgi:hypothetical protein
VPSFPPSAPSGLDMLLAAPYTATVFFLKALL